VVVLFFEAPFESPLGAGVDDGVEVVGVAAGAAEEPDESELDPLEPDSLAPEEPEPEPEDPESEPELEPDPPSGFARESVR
jgi:hypothetical protein